MSLASLFLEGDAERDRDDWMEISLRYSLLRLFYTKLLTSGSLPFYGDTSCALGVMFKTYLDELHSLEDPTSGSSRAENKEKGKSWLVHGDFRGSFDDALNLWDAVSSQEPP